MLSFLLVMSMAVCLCACSGGIGNKEPALKIAILTSPESQTPEEYRRAAEIAQEYKYAEIFTCADSRVASSGVSDVYTKAVALAEDKSVGAIIFARANRYTKAAAEAAKAKNPKLLIVCTAPEEDVEKLGTVADMVLTVDTQRDAAMMVEHAKEQGAQVFIFYSPGRHQSTLSVREAREAAEVKCAELGMEYKFVNCYDTLQSLGLNGAKQFIREDISRQMKNYDGKKLAVFSTEQTVQPKLVELALEKGFILAGTGFPSPYEGYASALNINLGKNWDSKGKLLREIKSSLKDRGAQKGQFVVWNELTGVSMLNSAFEYARSVLCGDTPNMAKIVKANFSNNIKLSDKLVKNCWFVYAEDYYEL